MLTEKKISVIVPCYKDEPNVEELVRRLREVLCSVTKNWEIIYVNDSSPDNAEFILKDIAKKDSRVIVINMSRNFGVMSVFRAGLDVASGDAIVIMDGDLQDPPEVIPDFIKEWQKGNLVVYGVREKREESILRKIGYKLFYKIWKALADFDVPLDAGEFALIDSSVGKIISSCPERNMFLRGIRSWVGFPQTGVVYHRPNRFAGETTQSFFSYIGWSLKAISSFSIKPLRLISLLAVLTSVSMLSLLAVNLLLFLMKVNAPKGFLTLLVVLLFGFSMVLVSLAIISEYIIHIFSEVKRRPPYIVRSIFNKDSICKNTPQRD